MLIQGTLTAADCQDRVDMAAELCVGCAISNFLCRMTGKKWVVGYQTAYPVDRIGSDYASLSTDVTRIIRDWDSKVDCVGREVSIEVPDALLQH